VFGRRRIGKRAADLGPADDDYAAEPGDSYADEYGYPGEEEPGAGVPRHDGGPWDAAEPYPALERVDLGSLHVPVGADFEIQLVAAEQQFFCVTVRNGPNELELKPFAAPKSAPLWDDVRDEIAAELAVAGSGPAEERYGPFGVELLAYVPADPTAPAAGAAMRRVRFVGVDGPRWFLRGMFSGPAADSDAAAAPLEELMRQVVVVRGDHPVPPRELLELRLPPEALQALAEEQARAEEEGRFSTPLNPFDRGPEFTETR